MPDGLTREQQGVYAERYYKAMKEIEKGWKAQGKRKQVDWKVVGDFYKDYEVGDFEGYFQLAK